MIIIPKREAQLETHTLIIYLISTFFVILSPGASAILVLSKGAAQGTRKGMAVIAGFNTAVTLYFILSALGITALIAASAQAFMIIKWLGVAYLVYLGLSAIFSKSGAIKVTPSRQKSQSLFSRIAQGFMVEFSNPKAILYFTAILPQFLDLSRPLIPQLTIMIIRSIIMQWLIYGGYALLGNRIAQSGIKPFFLNLLNKTLGGALLFVAFEMSRVKS